VSYLVPVLAMGAGVYGLRIIGFLLPAAVVPPAWERALAFVPIALLSALVAVGLAAPTQAEPVRWVAAAGAAVVAWRVRQMWACIASGMAIYWILRFA